MTKQHWSNQRKKKNRNLKRKSYPWHNLILYIKGKYQKSREVGLVYVISETWKAFNTARHRGKLLQQAQGRGFCVWCVEMITEKQAAWKICKTCHLFDTKDYIHGGCLLKEQPCGGCPNREVFERNGRVQ